MRNVECVIEHYGSCRFTFDPSAGSGSPAVEGRFRNDAHSQGRSYMRVMTDGRVGAG